MDDKEKEKFGVIIDKNDQPEGDKPQVDDNPSENSEQNQKDVNQSQNLSNDQPKVDIGSQDETKSPDNKNLSSSKENSPKNKDVVVEQTNENQNIDKNNEQEKKEHQVIHKKDGRLHIYVRQDKYKGELKSKNWVGRLYKDGKQKISSSGTPNLDEAIPILEKWFDDVHSGKQIEQTTNHDVKAVEYFIKDKFDQLNISRYKEFIHFGLTSQDVNNTAIPLSLKRATQEVFIPYLDEVCAAAALAPASASSCA